MQRPRRLPVSVLDHAGTRRALARLHRIGHVLRMGRHITATEMARRECTHRKTIVRDIAFLRELGWQIESSPQGYLLISDNHALLRTA